MKNSIINLSAIGFDSKYQMTKQGEVINIAKNIVVKKNKRNVYKLYTKEKKFVSVSLKSLYRKAFGIEFCIDDIIDLKGEQWKEVEGSSGKYYVSNYGRVKSLCDYKARILKPYKNGKGYLYVSVNNKKQFVHRLVATAFVETKSQSDEVIQVHHKDYNKENNNADNLIWLSSSEHRKEHYKIKKEKGEE